jgi:glycosyltransferase involved in cell wall biosynthesis
MSSKKIVLVGRYHDGNIPSAPIKVAQNLFDELVKQNCDITFIEYFVDGSRYNLLTKLFGEETISTNSGGKALRLGLLRFLILLIKSNPDIIHIVNFERFPLLAFLLRPFLKYKIIYSIHGVSKYERAINQIKIRKTYLLKENFSNFIYFSFSDKLLFLSEDSVKIASEFYKLSPDKMIIVANGIAQCFGDAYKRRRKKKGRVNRIVFVGDYWKKEKGLEFLFDILNGIDTNLDLFIIGSDYDKKNILCPNKAISIFVVDRMNEIELAKFYTDKDIFISTSLHDSFGMAPAEAMAAGLVPVVSNETGMSRYIENKKNGFVFNYGNAKLLSEILSAILNDESLQDKISAEASKIYEKLSWSTITSLYIDIYNLV